MQPILISSHSLTLPLLPPVLMDGSPGLWVPNKATPQSKPGSGTGPDRAHGGKRSFISASNFD